MRELKFRGKLLKDSDSFNTYKKGTIIQGGFCYQGTKTFIVAHYNVFEVESNSVEQFTGLKDKNGKNIYEGDICKVANNGLGEIFYSNKTAMFRIKWSEPTYKRIRGNDEAILHNHKITFEVIGNIHQNPELINNQK